MSGELISEREIIAFAVEHLKLTEKGARRGLAEAVSGGVLSVVHENGRYYGLLPVARDAESRLPSERPRKPSKEESSIRDYISDRAGITE
jgi:hypothetical protein